MAHWKLSAFFRRTQHAVSRRATTVRHGNGTNDLCFASIRMVPPSVPDAARTTTTITAATTTTTPMASVSITLLCVRFLALGGSNARELVWKWLVTENQALAQGAWGFPWRDRRGWRLCALPRTRLPVAPMPLLFRHTLRKKPFLFFNRFHTSSTGHPMK